MCATMNSEGSSLDDDVLRPAPALWTSSALWTAPALVFLIRGHTHREVDEQMLAVVENMDNNDCTDMPALVAISDQEVEEVEFRVDDYTDLPAH